MTRGDIREIRTTLNGIAAYLGASKSTRQKQSLSENLDKIAEFLGEKTTDPGKAVRRGPKPRTAEVQYRDVKTIALQVWPNILPSDSFMLRLAWVLSLAQHPISYIAVDETRLSHNSIQTIQLRNTKDDPAVRCQRHWRAKSRRLST